MHNAESAFHVAAAVAEALDCGKPVVALETAVLTHGLPRPLNVEVSLAMEDVVREAGALPATIGLVGGRAKIGLSREEIRQLGLAENVRKCSLRDLALAAADGANGGCTVAACLALAHRAGIRVFATGGIGGVHRGSAWDVSADLVALGRYPICVICSGPKSLLDLEASLEVLETQGVALLGWRCDRLPAFYVDRTPWPLTGRVESPSDAAAVMAARDALGLGSALLVTVPLSAEDALMEREVEALNREAHEAATERGVRGAQLTPFVLSRMAERSEGRTLAANRALLEANAGVAAEIAVADAKQRS